MFHLHPLCAFYTFFFEGCHHFPAFPTSLLYPWLFKECIPNNYWFKLDFYVSGLDPCYLMCLLVLMPIIKWIM
jgi:hypothetical protein